MAYPPSVLATNRTNVSAVLDNHPGDHNAVNQAVNDIVTELGSDPSGAFASVQARFGAQQALLAWKRGTTVGLLLNAVGGIASPIAYVTATMVAGRLYRYEALARALGNGAYLRLQRDGANYPDPVSGSAPDFYIPPAPAGGNTYSHMNYAILLRGSDPGNAGSHTWRLTATSATTGTSAYYDDNGGYAAIWDLGPDPGTQ